ncbi:MAG: hypothetical protein ACE5HU_02975, partial [Acidobacteriota bacterium]
MIRRVQPSKQAGFLARAPLMAALLVSLICLTGPSVRAVGTTWHVDDATCPAVGSGSLADPYCRIQDAICTATSGDTVSVAPGLYAEAVRMRPGVSLISQGGASVTTIDAFGQPCTSSDFCSKRTGNQCSVVTFASGHTPSTVLDGFTITGGEGLIQTSKVAGGGIFVFSSPTITNNIITNNVLAGPLPQAEDLRGAGVYVAVGQAIISNNTITGNRAIPVLSGATATSAYGGGMWVGFNSAPAVIDNIIQNNTAGDPNVNPSISAGGGLVIFPGPGPAAPVIDRNVIADNVSDTSGGGISLLTFSNTGAEAVVTNNVIAGNIATLGGGIYSYYNRARINNNTITGNEAFLGGGLYLAPGDNTLPVTLTNNVIAGNPLRNFGGGGGLYTLQVVPNFQLTVSFNDFWNNQTNHCDGILTDAACVGMNGNFSADPLFVDEPGRDFHLDPNSPAIDAALASAAPP